METNHPCVGWCDSGIFLQFPDNDLAVYRSQQPERTNQMQEVEKLQQRTSCQEKTFQNRENNENVNWKSVSQKTIS